jgi:hypothetical protein
METCKNKKMKEPIIAISKVIMSQPQPWACDQGKRVYKVVGQEEARESHHIFPGV